MPEHKIEKLPIKSINAGVLNPDETDEHGHPSNYTVGESGLRYRTYVMKGLQNAAAVDPAFSVTLEGVYGLLYAVGVVPVDGSPPADTFNLTLTDEHGREWTISAIAATGNPTVPLDTDILIQSAHGELTIECDDFGGNRLGVTIVLQFLNSVI